jgi:hypothetical protein
LEAKQENFAASSVLPNVRGDDLVRCLARFDPFFHCANRIKGIRAITAAAMVYPWSHEEAAAV